MRKLVTAAVLAVSALVAAPASALVIFGGPIPDLNPTSGPISSIEVMAPGVTSVTYTLTTDGTGPVLIKDIEFSATAQASPEVTTSLNSFLAEFSMSPPTIPLVVSGGTGSQSYPDFVLNNGDVVTFFVLRDAMGPEITATLSFNTMPVPVPAALPLMLTAIGGMVLIRRKSKAVAA